MLKKEGKGSRCKASEILTDGEIEQFCDTGALGCSCPDVLQILRGSFYVYHMDMEGCDEHYVSLLF